MRIELDHGTRDLLLHQAATVRHNEPRGDAIHVSDLLYCLRKAFFERSAPGKELLTEDRSHSGLTMMLGEAFQAWLLPGISDTEHRVEFEDIVCTPDGIVVLQSGERVPLEIKSTRTSSAKVPGYSYSGASLNHYIDQVAAYCLALGTRVARLAVLYMSGDYKANRDAKLVVYSVEFTEAELERWAKQLRHRRDQLREALDSGNAPALSQHLDWMCKYCAFREKLCPGGSGRWEQNFTVVTEWSGESGK